MRAILQGGPAALQGMEIAIPDRFNDNLAEYHVVVPRDLPALPVTEMTEIYAPRRAEVAIYRRSGFVTAAGWVWNFVGMRS